MLYIPLYLQAMWKYWHQFCRQDFQYHYIGYQMQWLYWASWSLWMVCLWRKVHWKYLNMFWAVWLIRITCKTIPQVVVITTTTTIIEKMPWQLPICDAVSRFDSFWCILPDYQTTTIWRVQDSGNRLPESGSRVISSSISYRRLQIWVWAMVPAIRRWIA